MSINEQAAGLGFDRTEVGIDRVRSTFVRFTEYADKLGLELTVASGEAQFAELWK